MKRILILLCLLLFSITGKADDYYFCGGGFLPDENYYNLFAQEIIQDPAYYPFLLSQESAFYPSRKTTNLKNENIEEWQDYLGLSYKETHYLVFEASREDIQKLINQEKVINQDLDFADQIFIKKHKQALLYIDYAKYLEPYMRIIPNANTHYYWGNNEKPSVANLDYNKVINVLKKSWNAEKDKELKLRYGYQLVRFAHYNRKYKTAVAYFKKYVQDLGYKPIMYYYALDQKGGAERALGNPVQANADFFKFFVHTKNKKESAYNSLNLFDNLDLESLLQKAQSKKAKNDIYLLLGYNDFNNPLSSFSKIIKTNPNAIQAKVLMARAINQLERNYLPVYENCPYNNEDCLANKDDRKLPLSLDDGIIPFLNQTMQASLKQVKNKKIEDKDFWNLTTAYLYFIQKKNNKAKEYLSHVSKRNKEYKDQKEKLALLMDITDHDKITSDFETHIYTHYKKYLDSTNVSRWDEQNSTGNFIRDLIANRYFLQKDYAKAFLIHHKINALESNPDERILNAVIKLHHKKYKSDFEKYLLANAIPEHFDEKQNGYVSLKNFECEPYLNLLKGTVYLNDGKFKKS